MKRTHILIVEDEAKVSDLLCDYLQQTGYRTSVQAQGDRVIAQIKRDPPDLILLDIVLPGKDGMTLCKDIRTFSSVPIIMLTARIEEIDRLLGLELGADDYVCKPFSFREVVARTKAILRRVQTPETSNTIHTGAVSMDLDTRQASANQQLLNLTPNEFALLKIMLLHPDKVFSRNELIQNIQGYQYEGYERTIDTHIKNLRKKIAQALPEQEVISTVFGVGYKLNYRKS